MENAWVCYECITKHSLPVPADKLLYMERPTCVICDIAKPRREMVLTERRYIGDHINER